MAWTERGKLAGGAGLTDAQRRVLFGDESYDSPPYGELVWSGPTYNPAGVAFTRLRVAGDGRLRVAASTYGAAVATNDTNCYLLAPVSGLYLLSATQAWLTDNSARGAGLTTSISSAVAGVRLWQDIGLGRFVCTSKTVYLPSGTRLYPWVWNGVNNAQMTGSERGMDSTYSIQYVGPG